MDQLTQSRVQRLTGKRVSSFSKTSGGYTPAERWLVVLDDGSSLFAKIGTTPLTVRWLRREHHWYQRIKSEHMPAVYGFEDDASRPMLLLEDLSSAYWPPPWSAKHLSLLQEAMRSVASTRPLPEDLKPLEVSRAFLSGWDQVQLDPGPFLSLGLCSPAWLESALPILKKSQDETPLAGEDLVHFDLRSDNLCFVGERVVLVDWNGPARGNRLLDLAVIASSLRFEGGPTPEEWSSEIAPFASILAGYFAANAGLPMIPDAPRVRWIQLRQLRIALPWAVRALGLPPLDIAWARREGRQIDDNFSSGKITEQERATQIEEVLIDAYLSSNDPRAQSGKSGDEDEWRWSRELILDAVEGTEASLLDVGCANGYLMESLVRWGAARGLKVDPFGLEISARMASLAQRRLPQWAEQIWVGDILSWAPPRRFDLVHVGLDYVIESRQKELLDRLLREFVAPGGRVVIRAERVTEGAQDIPSQLTQLGVQVGGVIERVHPTTGIRRRTAWVSSA